MKYIKLFLTAFFCAALAVMCIFFADGAAWASSSAAELYGQTDWFVHGVNRGLYANPELDHTIAHRFQNETISDIIKMSGSVPDFDIKEFFGGTVFDGCDIGELRSYYDMKIDDMSELAAYIAGANKSSAKGMPEKSSEAVLTAYPDSDFRYFKIPAYNAPHGALYRLSLDGKNGLCINYGMHSPSGTYYRRTDFAGHASPEQIETIKIGVLFSLYYHNIDTGNGGAFLNCGRLEDIPLGDWTYLMAQVWCWCAMLDMTPWQCARQFAALVLDWGDYNKTWADSILYEADVFLSGRYYEYYNLDTYLFGSNSDSNQVIFVYDYNSISPCIEIDPSVATSVINKAAKTTQSLADGIVKIVDTVYYKNLIIGKKYEVYGLLMLKEMGAPLIRGGSTVSSKRILIPTESSGEFNMEFEFDSGGLAGKTIVVFESVNYEGKAVVTHNDINDEAQSIHFAAVSTFAYDKKTGIKNTNAEADACVMDMVSYSNLLAGEVYKLAGTLVDAKSGEPLMIDGTPVFAEREFTAGASDGSIDLGFCFDASGLAGRTLVVFEQLYYKNKLIACHKDISDEAQMIFIPGITTIALDKSSGTHHALANQAVSIEDNVFYRNLTPGLSYRAVGNIADRDSGKMIVIDGEPLTASTEFIPDSQTGSVTVEYEVPGSAARGRQLVVYEDIYYGDTLVASHGDADNLAQVITVDGGVAAGDDSLAALWIVIASFAVSAAGGVTYVLKRRSD